MEYKEHAAVFKALGDETRLKIVLMLVKGRFCACKLLEAFNFTQPTLSYHMKQLRESGLVTEEKEGKWRYYFINQKQMQRIKEIFSKF